MSTKKIKTVLIVEDETPLSSILRDKLTHEGFFTIQARNGEEAIATALRECPDLILLDILIPKVDGMTVLKEIRANDGWGKNVPVIILTNLTSNDEQRMRDITEAVPTYYLRKVDQKLEDIVEKIRKVLGE